MRAGSQDENMMRSDVPPLSCWRCVPYALIEVLAIFLAQNERKKIGFSYLDILYFLIWRCILGGRLSCWAIAAGYIHCQFKSSKCWDDNVQNQTEIKVKRIWRWQTQHWQHHFSTTTASFIYLLVSFLGKLFTNSPASYSRHPLRLAGVWNFRPEGLKSSKPGQWSVFWRPQIPYIRTKIRQFSALHIPLNPDKPLVELPGAWRPVSFPLKVQGKLQVSLGSLSLAIIKNRFAHTELNLFN